MAHSLNGYERVVYGARWVVPVSSPPLENGAVVVANGIIEKVGDYTDIKTGYPGARKIDLEDSILLPGLVNAHTHLDNSAYRGRTPQGKGNFADWIEALLSVKDNLSLEKRRDAAAAACGELVGAGTIAVGDVSPSALSPPLLAELPLWAAVFVEISGFSEERGEANLEEAKRILREIGPKYDRNRMRLFLSPHALYSTHEKIIRRIFADNSAEGGITTFHVAESRQEADFLNGNTEAFETVMRRWGYWDVSWQPPRQSPLQYLQRLGGLKPGTVAVHCVQVSDEEIALLAESDCSVCLCPRSNDYIGIGRPRICEMLEAGIEPCLGTDGLGSVDSLNLFDEMAFVRKVSPGIEPAAVLRMATINGACALRLDDRLGSLDPGKVGRFLAYTGGATSNPLETVTSGIDSSKLSWVGTEIE